MLGPGCSCPAGGLYINEMAQLLKLKGLTHRYHLPTDKDKPKKRARGPSVKDDPELEWLATNTRATYEGAIDSLASIL